MCIMCHMCGYFEIHVCCESEGGVVEPTSLQKKKDCKGERMEQVQGGEDITITLCCTRNVQIFRNMT